MLLTLQQWNQHIKAKLRAPDHLDLAINRCSFVSVIADAAEVRVYVIRREMLVFMTKRVKKEIMSRIYYLEDKDRPLSLRELQIEKANYLQWGRYKQRVAATVLSGRRCHKT